MISVLSAQLTGLFIEATLYGIYLVTFGACLLPRTFRDRPEGSRRWTCPLWRFPWIALVTIALFIISTLHLALGLVRLLGPPRHPTSTLPRDWVTNSKVCPKSAVLLLAYQCTSGHAGFCASTDSRWRISLSHVFV
jgi:hypothetical protein